MDSYLQEAFRIVVFAILPYRKLPFNQIRHNRSIPKCTKTQKSPTAEAIGLSNQLQG